MWVWYYFYSDLSGGTNTPPDTNNSYTSQIEIKDNQTSDIKGKARAKLRRTGDLQPDSIRPSRAFNNESSGSRFNRFSVLDELKYSEGFRPSSPTGSEDYNETIKPVESIKDVVYKVYNSKNKKIINYLINSVLFFNILLFK